MTRLNSGSSVSATAATTTPHKEPTPPTITIDRIEIDTVKPNAPGMMKRVK